MTERARIEKFTRSELDSLRSNLLRSTLDTWQAADVIGGFLAGRGYGASSEHLRSAVQYLDWSAYSLDRMQETLEQIAFVM